MLKISENRCPKTARVVSQKKQRQIDIFHLQWDTSQELGLQIKNTSNSCKVSQTKATGDKAKVPVERLKLWVISLQNENVSV